MAYNSKTLKGNFLGILYKASQLPESKIHFDLKEGEDYFYAANPKHLLKKYVRLITAFANSQTGRDFLSIPNFQERISLLTPAGYHIQDEYAIIYSRYPFLVKLERALQTLDLYLPYIKDFNEALKMLYWILGLIREPSYIPAPLRQIYHDQITVNPAAGANSPVDGWVQRSAVDETFSTIRGGAGTTADTTGSSENTPVLSSSATTDQFAVLRRGIFCFDTSSIGINSDITSAIISFVGSVKNNGLGSP